MMENGAKKILIIFFIFTFFALKANAQLQSGDIVLEINPKYPKANESVTATLSTFTTNLNNAKISWKLNGDTMIDGIGKNTFSFSIGNSLTQTTLEVKIETINGSIVNKKIIISPSGVDMLWQATDTYAPPFYKGKTLAPTEGNIKVVAIPSNQNLAGYNYKWKQDSKVDLESSGYEKNFYLYKNSYLEENNTVEVTTSDLFGSNNGLGRTTITPTSPKIVFYEKDPLLGTKWESAIANGFKVSKDGTTIIAEPYFFSIKDLNSPNYSFDWFLNGEKTLIPDQKNSLSIKPASDQTGTSNIKITINNIKTLFQSVTKELNVNF